MANYKTPWNKGLKQSEESLKAKRVTYYQANREHIIANVTARATRPEIRAKRLEYMSWHLIYKKYGITKDQWFAMYDKQTGRCGICDKPKPANKKSMVVDHCHTTGKVRKLLCQRCNLIMGTIDNDILLAAALRYKDEFK